MVSKREPCVAAMKIEDADATPPKQPSFLKTFFGAQFILIPIFWALWLAGPKTEVMQFAIFSTCGSILCGAALGIMNVLLNLDADN